MTVVTMPVNVKFTQAGQAQKCLYSIFFDSGLVEKYKNYARTQVVRYTGTMGDNPLVKANNELNTSMFGRDMHYYNTLQSGQSPSDMHVNIAYMLSTLSNNANVLFLNSGKSSYTYYSIVTDSDYVINRSPESIGAHTPSGGEWDFESISRGSESIAIVYGSGNAYVYWRVLCYPENMLATNNPRGRCAELIEAGIKPVEFALDIVFALNGGVVTGDYTATLYATGNQSYDNITINFTQAGFDPVAAGASEYDTENKYGFAGNSGVGGGDGEFLDPDSVNGAGIPDLPSVSAANLGFITIYNPTAGQLSSLSQFMWSNIFDLDTYKKLFSDPMQSIIGLGIVPVAPSIGGNKNVMFGSINSGIAMNYLSTNYAKLDCGSVKIEKYIGSFLDYDATQISLYLPYIGIHDLDPRDVIGHTIHVVYNIDVLTGACSAFVEVSDRGVMYSFNGSCITNVPLTSINFGSAIQNAVTAVCSGASLIAGMASGAAPISAMGAMGLLNSAANLAINSKPQVQRSGALGGSAGIMSIQKPYVIIQRPRVSVPNFIENYVGQTSNITMRLGDLTGFTMVEYIHLHDIPATSEELKEIETLLKAGVIL